MIIYRICKREELINIFSYYTFKGKVMKNDFSLNNHNYHVDKEYLHFFSNLDSVFYLRTLKERYLCIYDIPINILNKYEGIGYYLDYFNFYNLNEIVEYAIDSNELELKYIKSVSYIKEDIDIDDYLTGYNLDCYMELLYDSDDLKRVKILK